MPRNSSGVYSLPDGYRAATGETILASQHNPPLEDVAQALTGSVPRNGSAPMTAPHKAADGDATSPGYGFNSTAGLGFFRTPNGIGVAVNGAMVAEFSATGFGIPAGAILDWGGALAPTGWLVCDGRAISRATYAALFAAIGATYGAGDNSTTFNLPDFRGRTSVAPDNLGGTDANRLTHLGGARLVPGSGVGSGQHVLSQAEIPAITPTGSTDAVGNHQHPAFQNDNAFSAGSGGAAPFVLQANGTATQGAGGVTGPGGAHSHSITMNPIGGGLAHNNVQPALVVSKIIKV